jgi:hypothetical protein
MSGIPGSIARGASVGQVRDLLRQMDARARAITLREVQWIRSGQPFGCPPEGHSFTVIRGASCERMRIRHALRALETPSRALALLHVV